MTQAIAVDEKVSRFREEVLPRLVEKYRPTRVLVFGSRARGDAREHSDLDVLILSPTFDGMKWLGRSVRVYEDCDIRLDVELLCYTPEEYARQVEELGIVRTATAEGVDLLSGSAPTRVAEPGRGERRGAWRAAADRLLKQAERDLVNARKNIGIEAYEVAAFLAHQAVEKRLKAAWVIGKRTAAPHRHSLLELGAGLGVPKALRRHLVELNEDYTAARYPDAARGVPYEVYDRETAERKVNAAEELFRWLRSLTAGRG